jgi:hypothetical protein
MFRRSTRTFVDPENGEEIVFSIRQMLYINDRIMKIRGWLIKKTGGQKDCGCASIFGWKQWICLDHVIEQLGLTHEELEEDELPA